MPISALPPGELLTIEIYVSAQKRRDIPSVVVVPRAMPGPQLSGLYNVNYINCWNISLRVCASSVARFVFVFVAANFLSVNAGNDNT
jgi:hypothetical protein